MSSVGIGDGRFLLDYSVFARSSHPRVASILKGARPDQLVASGALAIEALYSARNRRELEFLHARLTRGMPYVDIDEEVWRLAIRAQVELGGVADRFHRRPPIDYLTAATAHRHRLGVLHYDHDYDLIAEHSSLDFESRWAAAPGTI